jgi:FMN-dependent NADH-azoreductase
MKFLCSCLHKYLFVYLFSMYNYFVTTILLLWIVHIPNYGKTFEY